MNWLQGDGPRAYILVCLAHLQTEQRPCNHTEYSVILYETESNWGDRTKHLFAICFSVASIEHLGLAQLRSLLCFI